VRDDRIRLQDIVDAAEAIVKYSARGREAFEKDELIQTWILHHLQIIGEAARGLSPDFREQHPDEIWAGAVGMRDILVHRYFAIDPDAIWEAVQGSLAHIKGKAQAILVGEK